MLYISYTRAHNFFENVYIFKKAIQQFLLERNDKLIFYTSISSLSLDDLIFMIFFFGIRFGLTVSLSSPESSESELLSICEYNSKYSFTGINISLYSSSISIFSHVFNTTIYL